MVSAVMPDLLHKLAAYPEDWVIRAIDAHERESEWFPSLFHIVNHMQPDIERRERQSRRTSMLNKYDPNDTDRIVECVMDRDYSTLIGAERYRKKQWVREKVTEWKAENRTPSQ